MGKIVIKQFIPALELGKIEIAEENVRKSRQKAGLEGLMQSIQKFGLVHPVIVIRENNSYKLIVGQRRYLAFKELGKSTIPALVVEPISSTTQKVVSLSENIHRRALPYNDTIAVCDALYNQYTGGKFERVEKIAKNLGISPSTVSKYLAYRLVPKIVRDLVDEGKLSAKRAYGLTTAFWPNEQKIVSIAKNIMRMTKSESDRAIDYGKKNPAAAIEEILTEARKPKPSYELVIPLEPEKANQLEQIAEGRKTDIKNLVMNLIDSLLEEEGST